MAGSESYPEPVFTSYWEICPEAFWQAKSGVMKMKDESLRFFLMGSF